MGGGWDEWVGGLSGRGEWVGGLSGRGRWVGRRAGGRFLNRSHASSFNPSDRCHWLPVNE